MPQYNAMSASGLWPGDSFVLVNTGDVIQGATPYASQQFALGYKDGQSGARLRFRGSFSGAPGAFEVDIQEADSDVANNYSTVAGATAVAVDANNNFYIDVIDGAVGPFFRANVKSLTNAVTLTMRVVRI